MTLLDMCVINRTLNMSVFHYRKHLFVPCHIIYVGKFLEIMNCSDNHNITVWLICTYLFFNTFRLLLRSWRECSATQHWRPIWHAFRMWWRVKSVSGVLRLALWKFTLLRGHSRSASPCASCSAWSSTSSASLTSPRPLSSSWTTCSLCLWMHLSAACAKWENTSLSITSPHLQFSRRVFLF